jgi:hypothetical protein
VSEILDAQRSDLRYFTRGIFEVLLKEPNAPSPFKCAQNAIEIAESIWKWSEEFLPPSGRSL